MSTQSTWDSFQTPILSLNSQRFLDTTYKMGREDKTTWKAGYFVKLIQLLDEYPKCFIVGADNVGSKQLQQIRRSLREHATVLMGKNTMIRKAIRGHLENNPGLEKLLPHIKGNVGFVFTKLTWLKYVTSSLRTVCEPQLVPVPWLHAPYSLSPRTLVWVLRRHLSSRLCRSRPRFPREQSKLSRLSMSSRKESVSMLLLPLFSTC